MLFVPSPSHTPLYIRADQRSDNGRQPQQDQEVFEVAERHGDMEALLEEESGAFVLNCLNDSRDASVDHIDDDEEALKSEHSDTTPAAHPAKDTASATSKGPVVDPMTGALIEDASKATKNTLFRDVRNELMSIFSVLAQPGESCRRRQELMASLKQLASILLRHHVVTFDNFGLRLPGGDEDKLQLMDDIVDYYVDRRTRGISFDALASIFGVGVDVTRLREKMNQPY